MTDTASAGLVLNYRDALRTAACVANLSSQGVSPILVWDNSGDEGHSAGELRRHLASFTRVHIFESSENIGFAAGANRGLRWLAERYPALPVLLINNDARLLSGAVSQMTETLERKPRALIVFPTISHGGNILGVVFYHRFFGLITSRRLPGSFPYPSGCCLLVNNPSLQGRLFEERYFMYGEDIQLGFRLRDLPESMVHLSELLVVHEGSASSGKNTLFYEERMVAAHLLLARDLANSRLGRLVLLAGRLPMLLARAVLRSCKSRSLIPFAGLRSGFQLMIETERHEANAPATRS